MTITPGIPNTGPMRDFPPGPHAGVDTDPVAVRAPGSIDTRARNALTLGVLSLVLPRSEMAKPKRIQVRSA